MISNSFYLYPKVINAYSLEYGMDTIQRFRNVYQRNFKLSRGVNNVLDFNIKNQDQKNISVVDDYFVFSLLNYETQELLLQVDGIDSTDSSFQAGKVRVNLSATDLENIEPGFYKFTLVKETRNYVGDNYEVTDSNVLYIDTDFNTFSTIEILPGIFGEPVDSFVIDEFTREFNTDDDIPDIFYSSLIDAKPEVSRPSSVHTLAIYTTDYTGSINIQGSLDEGGNPKNWVDLIEYTPAENVEYKNVIGKYNFLRVKHSPTNGTLDKLVYRS